MPYDLRISPQAAQTYVTTKGRAVCDLHVFFARAPKFRSAVFQLQPKKETSSSSKSFILSPPNRTICGSHREEKEVPTWAGTEKITAQSYTQYVVSKGIGLSDRRVIKRAVIFECRGFCVY